MSMENSLIQKNEFKQLLSSYEPCEELLKVLPNIKLVLLVSPAATGRNTIIRKLLELGNYHYLISDTTRKMRTNNGVKERDGVEYWFVEEGTALADLRAGKYLGPAVIHDQQFSGINLSEILKAYNDNKVAITDIDIQGSEVIKKYKENCINVFTLPPSFEEWMRRLDSRGVMDFEEKKRRLQSAAKEIERALMSSDYVFFINDDLDRVVKEIDNFISTGKTKNNELLKDHASKILSALYSHPFWHS